jgi:hypothetical protein
MKLLGKIILILFSLLLLLAVVVLLQDVDPKQKMPGISPYSFKDTLANHSYNLDSLRAIIGNNKGLPEGFEIAAAIAYSAFPQLKDVNIDMILTPEGAPMESTLEIGSLFGPRRNRHYQILLNDAEESFF